MISLTTGPIPVAGLIGRHRIPPCDALNDTPHPNKAKTQAGGVDTFMIFTTHDRDPLPEIDLSLWEETGSSVSWVRMLDNRVSDGRGRHSQKSLRQHPANDRRTSTAARYRARVKCSVVMRSRQLTGEMRLDHNQSDNFRHAVEPYGPQRG